MELKSSTDHHPKCLRSLRLRLLLRSLKLARLGGEGFTENSHFMLRYHATISQRNHSFRFGDVLAELFAPLRQFLHGGFLGTYHVLEQIIDVLLKVVHLGSAWWHALRSPQLLFGIRLCSRCCCGLWSVFLRFYNSFGGSIVRLSLTCYFLDASDNLHSVCLLIE